MPPQHIAGLQVLLRALAWGTQVDVLPDDPLRPEGFAAALAARGHAPGGYTSLVRFDGDPERAKKVYEGVDRPLTCLLYTSRCV